MYKIIHFVSALIRQLVLPNPYINIIGDKLYADLFNLFIWGTILHVCAYILTGCGYTSGVDDPALGSLGYLISYCYVTALITTLGYFISNAVLFVIIFIIIYVISCVLVGSFFSSSINL